MFDVKIYSRLLNYCTTVERKAHRQTAIMHEIYIYLILIICCILESLSIAINSHEVFIISKVLKERCLCVPLYWSLSWRDAVPP